MSESYIPATIQLIAGGPISQIVTSEDNPQVSFDGSGIKATDQTGAILFFLDATTGLLSAKGVIILDPGSAVPAGSITGTIGDANIANVAAAKLLGQITDPQIQALTSSKLLGLLTASQIASIAAGQITGQLTDSQLAALSAAKISGLITASQIASIVATQITGQITAAQIASIAAGQITGSLTDAQIASLAASKITGQLSDTQIAALAASKVTGTLTDTQLSALSAAKVTGQLTDAQIAGMGATKIIGRLTAGQINVAQLSAIAADLGSVTAGTLTGATIQTAASGSRVVLDSSGFRYYDSSGVKQVEISSSQGGISIGATTDSGSTFTTIGNEAFQPKNEIKWVDTSTAALISEIGAVEGTGPNAGWNKLVERAVANGASGQQTLAGLGFVTAPYASANDPNNTIQVFTKMFDGVSTTTSQHRNILYSNGGSDFVQSPLLGGNKYAEDQSVNPSTSILSYQDLGNCSIPNVPAGTYLVLYGSQISGQGSVAPELPGFGAVDNHSAVSAGSGDNTNVARAVIATSTAAGTAYLKSRAVTGTAQFIRSWMILLRLT